MPQVKGGRWEGFAGSPPESDHSTPRGNRRRRRWWSWSTAGPTTPAAGATSYPPSRASSGFWPRTFAGHGGTRFLSDSTPRSGQTAALADDLGRFSDALGLRDVIVAGHDWGARAGYGLAASHPDLVRGLVAMSAGHASSGPSAPLACQRRRPWIGYVSHPATGCGSNEPGEGF